MYLFGFIFTVLWIQLSSLLPQEQVYSDLIDFQLGICNVKSDSDALHGAFVLHMERFRGYCYV